MAKNESNELQDLKKELESLKSEVESLREFVKALYSLVGEEEQYEGAAGLPSGIDFGRINT